MPVSLTLIISLNERTHPDTFILFQAQEKGGIKKKIKMKNTTTLPHKEVSLKSGMHPGCLKRRFIPDTLLEAHCRDSPAFKSTADWLLQVLHLTTTA